MSVQDKLTQQILGQNLTSKWTGEGHGSAEANARDMARILESIGISDISQFGKITVRDIETTDVGEVLTDRPRETYGNKLTNTPVPLTYNQHQQGNAWGGTFSGEGNTGYRVEFAPNGTPVFYTTGGSNNELNKYMPLLGGIGLFLGAPALGELFGAAGAGAGAGAAGAGMGAAELAALDLALGGAGGSLGAAELGAALAGGGAGAGAGLLESVFDPTFGGQLPPVIGGGAESVFDPTFGGELSPVIGGGGESVFDPTGGTGNIGTSNPIKLSDAKRALDIVNKLTGGNATTGTAGTAGTTGMTANELAQQQASNAALLNILGSKPELANIKSYKELFGEDLFGGKYVPPSAGGAESEIFADYGRADNPSTASQNEDEEQLFTGGHVDDFDVDALLQILRS